MDSRNYRHKAVTNRSESRRHRSTTREMVVARGESCLAPFESSYMSLPVIVRGLNAAPPTVVPFKKGDIEGLGSLVTLSIPGI